MSLEPSAPSNDLPDAPLTSHPSGAAPRGQRGGEAVRRLRFERDRSEEFFRVVKERVNAHLAASGLSRFGGTKLALKAVLFGGASLGFYLVTAFGGLSTGLTLLTAILFGLSALFFAINVGHEAAHDTVSPHKPLNRLMQFIAFAPLGADARLWKLRHVKSHHISPNVGGFDVDVSENGFVRLSPHQRARWYNRYQHLYAPLVYWLVDLHSIFYHDFKYLLSRRMENIEFERGSTAVLNFAAQKVAFALIMFVIPYLAMGRPWWHIALGALAVTFANSVVFVYMLIGTHHCEETAYPRAEADGVGHGWAYHQLATSMDWSPLSRVASFFAGGANAHAAHHLFPNVSHVHYIPITRIIQEEGMLHGMPYHQSRLLPMIASHFRHLKAMGQQPGPGAAQS